MPRPPFASFLFFSDTSQVTLLGSFILLFPVVSEESCIFKYSFSKLSVLKELAADSFRLKPRVMGKERDEEGNRLESQVGVALWSALVQFLGMGAVYGWLEKTQGF